MRVAFDHQIFGWQEYGGISRYFYELAVELATSCEQEVAVISPLYVNRYLAGAPADLKVVGLPVPSLPKSGRIFRAINSLFARPSIRYFRPDIIHETYYSSVRMAPKTTKVVLTVFDMIHERFSEHFPMADPTSREKALAVERADHIICISEQTRQDLIELLAVKPAKTTVVHHGFSLTSQGKAELQGISRGCFKLMRHRQC
jgi:glycosyltransferase involved in cell wall biosynthesis